jgi:hypothetical protein
MPEVRGGNQDGFVLPHSRMLLESRQLLHCDSCTIADFAKRTAWFEIGPFCVTPARGNRRPVRIGFLWRWCINWLRVFPGRQICLKAAAKLDFQPLSPDRVKSDFLEGWNGRKPSWASDETVENVGGIPASPAA